MPGGLEFLKIVTEYIVGADRQFAKGGRAHHLCVGTVKLLFLPEL